MINNCKCRKEFFCTVHLFFGDRLLCHLFHPGSQSGTLVRSVLY